MTRRNRILCEASREEKKERDAMLLLARTEASPGDT